MNILHRLSMNTSFFSIIKRYHTRISTDQNILKTYEERLATHSRNILLDLFAPFPMILQS
ncbi:hypothetical protein V144x_43040 [Gimesia aquarii]|uniref:Uncharacterized protein n=1 Tax=Gimesia aquarii TaxID=2527964 RepID=A0A517W0M7_9PLAN|nr:hypothetical protein V144x_43040 [Gimesia aquarii]